MKYLRIILASAILCSSTLYANDPVDIAEEGCKCQGPMAEQMTAFQRDAETNFRLMVRQHLKEEMPEAIEGQTDEAIMAGIVQAEQSAETLGITEAVPLAQYICLAFATGGTLDAEPDLRAYLSRTDIDQETKMQALIDELEDL